MASLVARQESLVKQYPHLVNSEGTLTSVSDACTLVANNIVQQSKPESVEENSAQYQLVHNLVNTLTHIHGLVTFNVEKDKVIDMVTSLLSNINPSAQNEPYHYKTKLTQACIAKLKNS